MDLFDNFNYENKNEKDDIQKKVNELFDDSIIDNNLNQKIENRIIDLNERNGNQPIGKSPFDDSFTERNENELKNIGKRDKNQEIQIEYPRLDVKDNKTIQNDLILNIDDINYLNDVVINNINFNNGGKPNEDNQIPVQNQKKPSNKKVSSLSISSLYNQNQQSNTNRMKNKYNTSSMTNQIIESEDPVNKEIEEYEERLFKSIYENKSEKDMLSIKNPLQIEEKYNLSLGKFKNYLHSENVFLQENIFYSKQEHSQINKLSQIKMLSQISSFFDNQFNSKSMMNIFTTYENQRLLCEINSNLNDEILKISGFVSEVKSFIYSIDFERKELINVSIGDVEECRFLNEINFFRDVISDGDSFFRSFIFKYIENSILTCNIHRLELVLYTFYNDYYKGNRHKIRYKSEGCVKGAQFSLLLNGPHVLVLLNSIIEFLRKGEKQMAHDFFIRYLISIPLVDIALVAYVRFILSSFIDSNVQALSAFDMYFPEVSSTSEIKPKVYMKDSGYDYKGLSKEISYFRTEVCPLGFILLSFIFKCEIEIISLFEDETDLINLTYLPQVKRENSNEIQYNPENIQSLIDFPVLSFIKNNNFKKNNLNFNESIGYLIGYNKSNIQKYISNIEFEDMIIKNKKRSKNKNGSTSSVVNTVRMCFSCRESKEKIFKKEVCHDFVFLCFNCISSSVLKIIIKRMSQIKKEGYSFSEFYFRSVQLNRFISFSNKEIISIFSKSIYELLTTTKISSCVLCNQQSDENLIVLDSKECKACVNCMKNTIDLFTEKKVILSQFEKKHSKYYSKRKPQCNCKVDLNIDELIKKTYSDKEIKDFTSKLPSRQENYCKKYCFSCLNQISSSFEKRKNFFYLKGEFLKTDFTHIVCKECTIKEGILNKDRNDIFTIKCNLCNVNHECQIKIWKMLMKDSNDGKCCCVY